MSHDTKRPAPLAVEVMDIGDPASANAGVEALRQDLVQLQSVPLQGRQVVVRLEGCIVLHYTTNLRVRTRPTLHSHLLACVTFGPQTIGSVDGLPIRPEIVVLVPPAAPVGFVAQSGYESISFLFRPEDIAAHLQVREQSDRFAIPEKVSVLQVCDEDIGGLFRWGQRLIDSALAQPELFNDSPEQRIAAREDLMDVLLSTLAGATNRQRERRERTSEAQGTLVRKAETYALAHTGDRLYVTDLCKAAGASERALEYAFRAVMGMSPVAYLARLRLHRVREALLAGTPGATSVTTEALNWGFWHFGEFSRAYRECFGELPSDTLKRATGGSVGRP